MAVRFAASLALLAFAVVCSRGAIQGNGFASVVGAALTAMVVFGAIGAAIGALARNAVRESVEREIRQIEQAQTSEQPEVEAAVTAPPSDSNEPRSSGTMNAR